VTISRPSIVTMTADRGSLTVTAPSLLDNQLVTVLLDGRKLWSFRVSAARTILDQERFAIDWPATLAERLDGHATLGLEIDGVTVVDGYEVQFGTGDTPLVVEDPATGVPLVVNKWGRLAPSFAGQDPRVVDDLLDEARVLEELVLRQTGIELFVTGGSLLGPVRDGRVMPGDDDVDFAYLSRHDNPSDVALESFALERFLVANGYEVIRLSAGHLQLMFPGASVTDRYYIDIFSYFYCNGWFYGTFHARERASSVTLRPLRPLLVNGRPFLGPAEPEGLLAAIYGPSWRTPDPAFTFLTPPSALRRYRGWLDDYNMDRENWEDYHRAEIQRARAHAPSDFAIDVGERLEPGSAIVELGCGPGVDAHYLAERGHPVLAIDYSRPALAHAASASTDGAGVPRFMRVNLNSTREVGRLRGEIARLRTPVQVYARGLFESLSPKATDATLLLLTHVLRGAGTRAFVHLEPETLDRGKRWTEYAAVDRAAFAARATRAGLKVSPMASTRDDLILEKEHQ
jgi:SAM-dependent methyltransferase